MKTKSHLLCPWVLEIAEDPHILDIFEDLIGPNIRCWSMAWRVKKADGETFAGWHQDSSYGAALPVVLAGLALSECGVKQGCLRGIPGSHRWGILKHSEKDDPIEVCRMHLHSPIPRLDDKLDADFGELEVIAAKALAKDRDGRYASAQEFAAALMSGQKLLDLPAQAGVPAASLVQVSGSRRLVGQIQGCQKDLFLVHGGNLLGRARSGPQNQCEIF